MDIKEIWSDILQKILPSVSSVAYQLYFEKAIPYDNDGKTLILAVNLKSIQDKLDKNFRPNILDAMKNCNAPFSDFKVILESETDLYKKENITSPENKIENVGLPFIKEYTFDNFIIGDSNRIAAAAALSVSEEPGSYYNPMFIYSRPGLGKTHLLNAVGNYLMEHNPEYKVLYITAENFTNDYVSSIRNNKNADSMQNFNTKYRTQDVLMIDDIQFLEKAEKTQEALFHIFNDLYGANKQIILTSDRPINNLSFFDERLSSRFASGILVKIDYPSFEERVAILQKKANSMLMNVPVEVLYYLAETEKSNIRILGGMLKTVLLYAKLNKCDCITVEFAKEALHDSVMTAKENITMQTVVTVCSNYFNIKEEDLLGKQKNKEFVIPRQYAIYVITVLLPSIPLKAIGDFFGGKDHSTIISSRDKIGRMIGTDKNAERIVEDIKNLVLNK
ncbi:MAG: chromosomal replication initiator protein DnaA [Clostridia bacterium]|nr:chromosomal replication initiator protein DnaA [Clostridia bacterium]